MTILDLWSVTPELILGILGLGLLVLDLVTPPEDKRLVGWIAILGLGIALLQSAGLFVLRPQLAIFGTYAVDPFAAFFKILVIASAILVLLAALEFYRGRAARSEGEVYTLIVFMTLGLAAMAAAADLIVLFLAIEFVSLISYVLAGSLKGDRKSNEAGVKYFFYGAAASAVMLYGFSYLYGATGTTAVYAMAPRAAAQPALIGIATVLVLAGLGFKMSLVPFHQWTPDVYEGAPTPVTAFLSVASKAAGFAALLRLFYVALPPEAWAPVLAALAVLTMSLGNLVALAQRNIKRMLAYSSIAHAGYMLIGVVSLVQSPSPIGSGLGAVLYYLLVYVFTNVGAFGVAIAVERAIGSDAIPDYAGLGARAPFLAFGMAVFMVSLTGIPPTGLFFGKFYVFGAAIQSGLGWLAIAGILNSVVSLYYYVGVIRAMYQEAAPAGAGPIGIGSPIRALLVVTLTGTFALGVYPEPFLRLAQAASVLLLR